jgi:hypothetical protein
MALDTTAVLPHWVALGVVLESRMAPAPRMAGRATTRPALALVANERRGRKGRRCLPQHRAGQVEGLAAGSAVDGLSGRRRVNKKDRNASSATASIDEYESPGLIRRHPAADDRADRDGSSGDAADDPIRERTLLPLIVGRDQGGDSRDDEHGAQPFDKRPAHEEYAEVRGSEQSSATRGRRQQDRHQTPDCVPRYRRASPLPT